MAEPKNVLFLCTGNSARSILAEAILNRKGAGRFRAYSAGSFPKDAPHPIALALLEKRGYDTGFARSKSWDEFAAPGAPGMDFIVTVCDSAAGEVCPVWPGHPMTVHWGIADPAAVNGPESARHTAFRQAYDLLERRIDIFLALPMAALDVPSLKRKMAEIGRIDDGALA